MRHRTFWATLVVFAFALILLAAPAPTMPVSSSPLPGSPPHAGQQSAQRHLSAPVLRVRLVQHGHPAAAVALDAQKPARECP